MPAPELRHVERADAALPDRMSPSLMSIRRLTIFIAVVLPAPDGPTRQQISPAGTVSVEVVDGGLRAARIALRHMIEDDLGGRAAHGGSLQTCCMCAKMPPCSTT